MSWTLQKRVWESSSHTGSALLTLLAIADFAREEEGGECFASVETIARKARLSPRETQKIINGRLVPSGELLVVRREGMTSLMSVTLPESRTTVGGDTPVVHDTPQPSRVTPQACRGRHPAPVTGDTQTLNEPPDQPADEPVPFSNENGGAATVRGTGRDNADRGRAQQRILKTVIKALERQGRWRMGRDKKDILATQIGNALDEGYPPEAIEYVTKELALDPLDFMRNTSMHLLRYVRATASGYHRFQPDKSGRCARCSAPDMVGPHVLALREP
jgi:hypothetical protein